MRYARTLLSLDKEIDKLEREHEGDTTPQFSIMFDMPDNYRSKMVITKNGKGVLTVKCFSWKETEPLRRAVKFGSNHSSRMLAIEPFCNIIQNMLQNKRKNENIVQFDPRILKFE